MDRFRYVAGRIHDAVEYYDIFTTADEQAIKTTYRELAKAIHPDIATSANHEEANIVFAKLGQLHAAALQASERGVFGQRVPNLVFVTTNMRHQVVSELCDDFDMTTGYWAKSLVDDVEIESIVKVAQLPADNELLAAEADALTVLAQTDKEHVMFYPKLLDSFAVADGRKRLRANAVERLDGFVNLEEVRRKYPRGLDPLHMSWIWRRVLWALGGAHEAGVLHGALVPSNIMIHPTLHGVVLVDWCYSALAMGTTYPSLRAIVGGRRDWYHRDILNRKNSKVAHDFAMASRSMQFLTAGANVPGEISQYFDKLAEGETNVTAYDLLGQYDAVLERLGGAFYPRKYRPLNW